MSRCGAMSETITNVLNQKDSNTTVGNRSRNAR